MRIIGDNIIKKTKKIIFFSTVLAFGLISGYNLTIHSLFPTCHGNFIFATAPIVDVHSIQKHANHASSVHLGLVHDVSFWRKHTWYYRFWVTNAKGEMLYTKKIDPKQVGGRFNLNSSGSLKWEEDGEAITAQINDFVYRCELSNI